ncbi:MAG TPA: hypothetical protein VGI80_01435, partial [Pyrinomonadaceae bacterium]
MKGIGVRLVAAALLLHGGVAPALPQGRQDDLLDSAAFFNTAVRRPPAKVDRSAEIEKLISQMTVEEKVGQMTQLTIDMVTSSRDQGEEIDNAKLEKAVVKYGVGSILNVHDQALNLDQWDR